MVGIGINGFGRIGRMVLRAAIKKAKIKRVCCTPPVVVINDPYLSTKQMAYLFRYDSVHGRFKGQVCFENDFIFVDGQEIAVCHHEDRKKIPWGKYGATYVVEATGACKSAEEAKPHLEQGAQKVVVTAPLKDAPPLIIGVNQETYDPKNMCIVTSACCCSQALASLVKVIHCKFQVCEGMMTTVHAYTRSQRVVDGRGSSCEEWRSGRAAGLNIIPAKTHATEVLGQIIPDLKGKIVGKAFRVPVPNVAVLDLNVKFTKETCYDAIKEAMKEAAEGSMNGIVGYTEDQVVSSDFNGSIHSCVFDASAGKTLNKTSYKLVAWYDNEYGYSCRVIDLIKYMQSKCY